MGKARAREVWYSGYKSEVIVFIHSPGFIFNNLKLSDMLYRMFELPFNGFR